MMPSAKSFNLPLALMPFFGGALISMILIASPLFAADGIQENAASVSMPSSSQDELMPKVLPNMEDNQPN
jgi:hypothetical protein